MNRRESNPRRASAAAIRSYAQQLLKRMQTDYLRGAPEAKADLARLRSIDPLDDAQALQVWETVFRDAPEELIGHGDEPEFGERVLVATMHLYARHQQSKSEPMHLPGVGLGEAIRRLANPYDADSREKPVMRRYHALTSATELREILQHLGGLAAQMRSQGVALDYARLAGDLFDLGRQRTRSRVRLAWARDLTRPAKQDDETAAGADA